MTHRPVPPRRAMGLAGAAALVSFACALGVLVATPNDAFWVVDCGAKALIAERLLETGFDSAAFDYPAQALDPTGAAFPIPPPFATRHGAVFVSQYPPAYSALAAPFLAAFGPMGLRLPAALGLAACAFAFTLWTAPAFGAAWAAIGGLVLALATPLFFYGVTVWEHTLTVALILAGVLAAARRAPRRLAAAGGLVALSGCLREETLLALPALLLASWLRDRSLRDALWIGAGAAPVVLALGAMNTVVFGDPLGVHVRANLHALPSLAASLRTGAALLAGLGETPVENAALAAAALLGVSLGVVAARTARRATAVWIVVGVVAGAVWARGVVAIFGAAIPFTALARWNGLAVQLPVVCLAGAGAVRLLRDPSFTSLRLGVVTGLGFLVLFLPFRVTVSDPALGGHWGPRMLLPAVPALLALALAAVRSPAPGSARVVRGLFLGLVGAGLLSNALAVTLLDAQKREVRALQQRIAARPERVHVTTHPALGQHLAPLWGRRPLLLARDEIALARVVADLDRAGIDEFLLIWRPDPRVGLPQVLGARCTPSGRHTGMHVRRIFDVAFYTCAIPRPASSRSSAPPID